jgi:hypothetical protein
LWEGILGTEVGHFRDILWTFLGCFGDRGGMKAGNDESWEFVRKMVGSYAHVCIDFWVGASELIVTMLNYAVGSSYFELKRSRCV